MGSSCSGGGDGWAYRSADPSGRLSPVEIRQLVLDKLRHSLFSGLMSASQLDDFAAHFTVRYYPPACTVIRKGAPLDALFVVGEGHIRMEVDEQSPGAASASGANGKSLVRQQSSMGPSSTHTSSNGAAAAAAANGGGIAVAGKGSAASQSAAAAARNLLCVKKLGEYFGESIFAQGKAGVHNLNVVTGDSGDCMLLVLTRQSFGSYCKKFPELAPLVCSVTLSMEKQLQQLDFFKGIEAAKMKMLVTMFHFVPLPAGEVLFRENDFDREAGNSLYFLYRGRVKVVNAEKKARGWTDERPSSGGGVGVGGAGVGPGSGSDPCVDVEEKILNTLESGQFLGEVGLMMDIPRTATIAAVESSLLLELSQNNFRHFITLVPEILAKFNSVLLEYNIHLKYFIHNPLVLNYFIQHCKSEFSTENVEFWMACRDFRLLDPLTEQDEIDAKAAAIRRTYIGANAEQQVNLKGSVEAKVIRGLKQVPISNLVFVDAEDEILGLMSSDSFGRFKSSDLFRTCIETVNSPYTAILRKLYLL